MEFLKEGNLVEVIGSGKRYRINRSKRGRLIKIDRARPFITEYIFLVRFDDGVELYFSQDELRPIKIWRQTVYEER